MALDIAQLVSEDLPRCQKFLDHATPLKSPPRLPLNLFVERSIMMHRNLIERWGGLEYRGPIVRVTDTSLRLAVAQVEFTELQGNITRLQRIAEAEALKVNPDKAIANQVPKSASWQYLGIYLKGGDRIAQGAHILQHRTLPQTLNGLDLTQYDSQLSFLLCSYYEYGPKGGGPYQKICQVPARIGQRTSSLIAAALDSQKMGDTYPLVVKEFDKMLQRLGEKVWTAGEIPAATTLSVRPSRFLKLGNMGEKSCYQNGGEHDNSKLFLGCDVPDSFVVLNHRGSKDAEVLEQQENVIRYDANPAGRAWGISVPDHGAYISNFYVLVKDAVAEAVRAACEGGFGLKDSTEVMTPGGLMSYISETARMYLNRDGYCVLSNTQHSKNAFSDAFRQITMYSSTFGAYTRHGAGPEFIFLDNGTKDLRQAELPAKWPYKDLVLRDIIKEYGARFV
jgi:hypothetical protein